MERGGRCVRPLQKHFGWPVTTLPPELSAELAALRDCVHALEAIPSDAQARVLLFVIAKFVPRTFTDSQILQLLRIGSTR